MLVLGLGLGLGVGLDPVGRGLDAIMLYTYVLVFVVWNLCPLDTCLREFWLFLPAQPLLRGFLARDSMLSALYAIARPSVCLSVCPSVCHTGGSVKNG